MTGTPQTPAPHPHRLGRAILKPLNRLTLSLAARIEIEGRENLPRSGPLLLAANHFSHVDPMVMVRIAPWPVEFLGGLNMVHLPPLLRWIPKSWGYIPVHRGSSSSQALRAAEQILNQGGVIGIFPEGGAWATVLRPARPGVAFLAARTGVPIVPMGFSGTEDVIPGIQGMKQSRVTVRIGKPLGPFTTTKRGRERRAELDAISETIMQTVADLLPPEKRGVFSDNPALRAAAQEVAAYPWDEASEKELAGRDVHYQ